MEATMQHEITRLTADNLVSCHSPTDTDDVYVMYVICLLCAACLKTYLCISQKETDGSSQNFVHRWTETQGRVDFSKLSQKSKRNSDLSPDLTAQLRLFV